MGKSRLIKLSGEKISFKSVAINKSKFINIKKHSKKLSSEHLNSKDFYTRKSKNTTNTLQMIRD